MPTIHRPFIFLSISLLLIFYLTMSTEIPVSAPAPQDLHYKYTVLKGFFMQSEDDTDDKKFDFVCTLLRRGEDCVERENY